MPFLGIGFRMVLFSILLMVVVLFYRRGLMGTTEFSWPGLFGFFRKKLRLRGKSTEAVAINPTPMDRAPLIPDPPSGEHVTGEPASSGHVSGEHVTGNSNGKGARNE